MQTQVKNSKEIKNMRESGRMLKAVLDELEQRVEAGMTLNDINEMARKTLKKVGQGKGKPAFYGYYGFPGYLCLSLNDEVVHGTPRDITIKDGDILSLDFGVDYRGMITDSARTFAIGSIDAKTQKLLDVTKESLYAGIDVLKDGVRVGDISAAIEKVLKREKLGIVRDLVGHGVGHELHEEPNIPNYGTAGTWATLKSGMTIAIEPMSSLGSEIVDVDDDKWTIRTSDGALSAHYEHTVLITDDGYEILT